MAKKIESKEETSFTSDFEPRPEFTNSAYSVVKVGNRYSVLRIMLNPVENIVGEIEIVKDDMNKQEAEEIFKINVAREIFMKQH